MTVTATVAMGDKSKIRKSWKKNQRYLKLKQSLFSNFTLLFKVWFDKQLTYLFIQNKEFQAMPTSYETYNLISFHDVILFKYTESRPEKKIFQI